MIHRLVQWIRRDRLTIALVVLTLALVVGIGVTMAQRFMEPRVMVMAGNGVFQASVAQTPAERTKGLSNTTRLKQTEAMLLVFDSADFWSIWMKDMNYPIDVVWLNDQKQVVYIVKNMPPDSYPKQFTPETAARYVLELPAGTVDQKAIKPQTTVRFELPSKGGA